MARGHVYRRQLGDGRMSKWHAVIDLPKGGDGRRRQVTRSFATKAEAQEWLARVVTERSTLEAAEGPLMSEHLTEWLDGQVYLRPSTKASYRAHIEKYLIPAFGCDTVSQLSPPQVERFAHDLAARGLAAGTVQRVLATLRSALGNAVRIGLIPANPASGIRVPASVARPARTWTPEESGMFLAGLGTSGPDVLLRLALTTGMRRGELLGLRWSCVSLTEGYLRVQASRVSVGGHVVEGPPKSRNGLRTVYLDPQSVHLLRRLKVAQQPSLVAGDGLVFVHDDGRAFSPWWVSRHFEQAVQRLGLPRIRFHDLRHSSATLGLAAGESLKEVSARLGHAGIGITADIYADVLPEYARASTQRRVALMTGTRQEGTDVA
jgi:integrase